MVNKLKVFIPALYLVLLVFSYVHYYTFYAYFGIDIGPYLSTAEMFFPVLPILPDLAYIVPIVFLLLTGSLLRLGGVYDIRQKPTLIHQLNHGGGLHQRYVEKFSAFTTLADLPGLLAYAALYFISLVLVFYLIAFPVYLIMIWIGYMAIDFNALLVLFTVWVFIMYEKARRVIKVQDISARFAAIMVFMVLFSLSWIAISTRIKAQSVAKGEGQPTLELYTDSNQAYTSGAGYRLIGQTGNYVFLTLTGSRGFIALPQARISIFNFSQDTEHDKEQAEPDSF
ncbi:MAG: hypothetical protein WBB45_19495 [Cyclobacteriaceae bacterium]